MSVPAWLLLPSHHLPPAERLFEAVSVSGNTLTAVVQAISSSNYSSNVTVLDLENHERNFNIPLVRLVV